MFYIFGASVYSAFKILYIVCR